MPGTRAGALKGWQTRRKKRTAQPGYRTPRITVRKHYHGRAGYLISGTDEYGRHPSIFVTTKREATRIANAIRSGREWQFNTLREREAKQP